jgi:hypothetical protein
MFIRIQKYFSFLNYVDRIQLLTVKQLTNRPWKHPEFNIDQKEFKKFHSLYQYYVTNK